MENDGLVFHAVSAVGNSQLQLQVNYTSIAKNPGSASLYSYTSIPQGAATCRWVDNVQLLVHSCALRFAFSHALPCLQLARLGRNYRAVGWSERNASAIRRCILYHMQPDYSWGLAGDGGHDIGVHHDSSGNPGWALDLGFRVKLGV